MKFLTGLFVFVSVSSFATTLPTCNVSDLASAKACMKAVGEAMPDYEEPNETLVSTKNRTMIKVMDSTGVENAKSRKLALSADFLGVMLEHGDEHHIYYFAMKKGSAKPVEILDINTADLSSDLQSSLNVSDLFLGHNAKKFDIYEELVEILREVPEEP